MIFFFFWLRPRVSPVVPYSFGPPCTRHTRYAAQASVRMAGRSGGTGGGNCQNAGAPPRSHPDLDHDAVRAAVAADKTRSTPSDRVQHHHVLLPVTLTLSITSELRPRCRTRATMADRKKKHTLRVGVASHRAAPPHSSLHRHCPTFAVNLLPPQYKHNPPWQRSTSTTGESEQTQP